MLPKSDIELGSTACVKDVDGEKCLQPRTDSDPSSLDSRKTTKAPIQRREEPHSQGTEDDGTQMSAPPDGGRVAWLQVLMAFLIACNSWGYICTFGVFQAHYVDTLERSHSDVSWIGSIQVFLVFFIGAFSGRATDAGYFRHCVIAGSICTVVGLFMTSLATTYWQVFLAHGLCLGLGSGLTSCPSLSLLATYFVKRRASVIAIAGFGGGSCGVIFPVIVQRLMPLIGFPWTIRILGFLSLAMAVVAVVCGRSRLPPRTVGPWIELAAFRDRSYVLFTLGMFLVFWGYWIALYFIGSFCRDIIQLSRLDAINLIMIMNGVGIAGRVLSSFLADRWLGPLNTIIPFVLAVGALLYSWTMVHTKVGITVLATCYGVLGAGVQTLFPATTSSLSTDLSRAGSRMGMVFTIVSFASLTGPPIAGALIQHDDGRFLDAQLFGGSTILAGCCLLCAARLVKTGRKLQRV